MVPTRFSSARTLVLLAIAVFAGCSSSPIHRLAPRTIGPYSGSVETRGLVFVAGQVGRERSSFAAEVNAAIDGVASRLADAGLSLREVVSTTVYLTDMASFAAMNEVYAARFSAPYPARTTVGVAALPGGASIEIAAIAARL